MTNKSHRPRARATKLELKVDYETSPTYRETPSSGSMVGVNAHGQVAIRFYTEHGALPRTMKHAIDPGGKVSVQRSIGDPLHVVRSLQLGAVMTLDQAKSLGDLLLEKVAERRKEENLRKETSPEGEAGE